MILPLIVNTFTNYNELLFINLLVGVVAYSADGVLGGAGLNVTTGEIIFTGGVGGLRTVVVFLLSQLSQGTDKSTVLVLLSFLVFDLITLSPV